MILIDYNDEYIYRMIDVKNDIHRVFNVNWLRNKRINQNDVLSLSRVSEFCATLTSFMFVLVFIDNAIDKFLNDLVLKFDEFNQSSIIVVSRRNAIVFLTQRSLFIHFASSAQQQIYYRHVVSFSTKLIIEKDFESNDINTSSFEITFVDFTISNDFFITLSKSQFFSFIFTITLNEFATSQQNIFNRWSSILRSKRDTFFDSFALLFKVNFIESHESKIYKEVIFDSNKKRD